VKLNKRVIKRGIKEILADKAVDGPTRSRILNSLVNYTYQEVLKRERGGIGEEVKTKAAEVDGSVFGA